MDKKKFTLWNRIVAAVVFLIAAVTYLLTIEPTASFWDCGEFIASSYKLEVGHPPGNPVFQLFARFATMFTGPEHAALAVNAMNAILSALTILLLYLTTVFLVRRIVKPQEDGSYSLAKVIAIFGSGAVGALAYTFSDTFWFSAVEGEVYAMSSLFTALVFWAMTKWYEQADQPYANRWLVLIAFLMGLSIGIHLLNLLTIPALVFMFYYRKREDSEYTFLQQLGIFGVSVVILAFILYGVIPYLPIIAAYFDLFFVNTLGLPFNTGAAFFMIALLALCFWGLFETAKRKKALLNTVLLCFTMIVIGFSLFSIVIIRSSAKTPTNEYQPDNPYTLVRYLGREQYGSNPLIYGQAFNSPYTLEETSYWAPMPKKNAFGQMQDEYIKAQGPSEIQFYPEGKMLFPRMWSSSDVRGQSHVEFYKSYIQTPTVKTYVDKNGRVKQFQMPTFGENLAYFFDYQMNWMYWRYFMWNFAGRQNDVHGQSPNLLAGNWESGIGFIDEARLGDQSDAPGYLKDNKGKNHYFMLPLILGLIGLFFQYARDKRGCWVTFLMFFMTGIAIVIYLNQPPYQARERDYAYAGSFYAFSIWIGMAVAALYTWVSEYCSKKSNKKSCDVITASAITALALCVPVLMAAQNWDDHNRSNRYTAVEMAKNYLNSVGENGILITHGDNDTFPLWYAQEVEGIRTDVRIANTSLLGTDWHIDQMKWAMNDSAPLGLKLGPKKYLYGTNEYMYIHGDAPRTIAEVINHINDDSKVLYYVHYSIPRLRLDDNSSFSDACFIASKKSVVDIVPDLLKDEVYATSRKEYLESQLGRPLKESDIKVESIEEIGSYVPTRQIKMPVNKENILKYGILSEKYADRIPDEITLKISTDKDYITKQELFMLDLLAGYQWDRPINMLNMGGEINLGQKEYMMYEGFSYKFVPVRNKMSSSDIGFSDPDDLYRKMKEVFTWDALKRTDYFIDYQNNYTFCGVLSQRQLFVNVAKELVEADQAEKAVEILDMCQECVPEANFPLDMSYYGFTNEYMIADMVQLYYDLGEVEKGRTLLNRFAPKLCESLRFLSKYESAQREVAIAVDVLMWMADLYQDDVYSLMETDKEKALEMLDNYLSWLPTELMYVQVESPVWVTYFAQCLALKGAEYGLGTFDTYAETMMSEFNSYVDEYAKTAGAYTKVLQKKSEVEKAYQDAYYAYASASDDEIGALGRQLDSYEKEYRKCIKEEEKLSKTKSNIEKSIYKYMYLMEDLIPIAEAYGSEYAQIMEETLQDIIG